MAGILAALSLTRAAQADETPLVDSSEIREHLAPGSPPLYFNSDSADVTFGEAVSLDIAIDGTGSVTSAKPSRGDDEYYERAVQLAMSLHFRPFERGGRDVAVTGPLTIPIFPRTRPPAERPFPRASAAETEISIQHTACYGTCPIYTVTIGGDGRVSYDGGFNVAFAGRVEERVDPAAVAALIEQFRAAQFFGLEDEYAAEVTDLPSTVLRLRLGKAEKKVVDYAGLYDGMPPTVVALERAVEHLARSARWVSGGVEIVDDLRAAGWDFQAPAAAGALACSIRPGAGPLVGALLARGVAPTGSCRGIFALTLAAQYSDGDVVDRLLAAGALDAPSGDQRQRAVIAAVRGGKPDILAAILRRGGDPDAREPEGDSALAIARAQTAPDQVPDWLGPAYLEDLKAIVALLEAAGAKP
ncbi:hypothetical protein DKG74_11330 [Zavarzinia aquatilis]|uniref:DUF6438 domain-containing protein n=1 Tax=Zavarzinia aquatilis TaxID=2211142 RepID=A0A317E625_9PROT|nr:hypothetical protein DKG74_11330 [Zavarzinia aquatilis]